MDVLPEQKSGRNSAVTVRCGFFEFGFGWSLAIIRVLTLGRIQDLTKGGSDKRPPKAVAPRVVRGMLPRNIFNFRASEMRFPAFSGAI